jgi:large subunit ribosomal protein L10
MRKEDKTTLIDSLAEKVNEYNHFYVADTAGLNAGDTSDLRRLCFQKDVKMVVVKNTIFKQALEKSETDFAEIYSVLKGTSAVLFSNTGNVPAKLIKEFAKKAKKPVLKGAYVEESMYIGENQLEALVSIKSKEELLGDVIGLLQSPIKNVVSALQSGGTTIHGILKTLGEKE